MRKEEIRCAGILLQGIIAVLLIAIPCYSFEIPIYPELEPYQPAGWSDKIVLSSTTGTTTDSVVLYDDDTIYLDWAVINSMILFDATAGAFKTALYIDNFFVTSWTTNSLTSGYYISITDYPIGLLSPGTHSIMIACDYESRVMEMNESNNTYTKYVTVVGNFQPEYPDLTPFKPDGWSNKIVVSTRTGTTSDSTQIYENDTIFIDWAAINDSNMAVTRSFTVSLYLDNNFVASWPSQDLPAGYYTYINDYPLGNLAAGTHNIRIVCDSGYTVTESNESNNVFSRTLTVIPVQTPIGLTYPQINGVTSNVSSNLDPGNTFLFTVTTIDPQGETLYYRFLYKAGYGTPSWETNKWQTIRDWSTINSTGVSFNIPGNYYVVGHVSEDRNWEFGDPQCGFNIVVE